MGIKTKHVKVFDEDGNDVTPQPLHPVRHVAKAAGQRRKGSSFLDEISVVSASERSGDSVCSMPFSRSMTMSHTSTEEPTSPTEQHISKQHIQDAEQRAETVIQDVTEDMLKEEIFVHITETELITVLDLPSTSVSAESDDAPGVRENNSRYAEVCSTCSGTDKYVNVSVQKMKGPAKNKQAQTDPVTFVDSALDPYNALSTEQSESESNVIPHWMTYKKAEWPNRVIHCDGPVTSLNFSYNNPSQLAVGLLDGTIVIYNIYDQHIKSCVYSTNPDVFLSCSSDCTIQLWKQYHLRPLLTFTCITGAVEDIKWSQRQAAVFGAVSEKQLLIWDLSLNMREPVIVQPTTPTANMKKLLFSTETNCVLVGDSNGLVSVYQLKNLHEESSQVDVLDGVISSGDKIRHAVLYLVAAGTAGDHQAVNMKFTEHLSAHITPEWRKQYIQYEAFKEMLYAAQDQAPSIEVTDEDTVKRYYAKFEEKFFQTCEKELAKINTFYSGNDCDEGPFTAFSCEKSKILSRLGCDCTEEGANVVFITFVLLSPEKLAEAQRRFATLQNELQSSLDAQRESWANGRGLRKRRTVFALSQQERCKHRNIKDLQLAFSEFYLSLILLQNYQGERRLSGLNICILNLNFTGFRKILKKHDKILETSKGADWRVVHVEVAPFYTCKKITQLISETETLVTTELEGGDRQRAMKRLRVPPLGAAQPAPAWTTFRVGLYCGVFLVLLVTVVITGAVVIRGNNVWPMIRIYRGGFLLIEFLFLLGINTYGWRQAGVNHVLIFELNPRNNLSHQHLFEIAGLLGVLWCVSLLSCLYSSSILLPMQANPLALYGLFFLFLINPFKTCYYKSRFWLLKLLFRVVTAPFHRVGFADFWLADQLNSLVVVLMDLEYMICFYSFELDWEKHDGLISSSGRDVCNSYSYGVRAVIQCLPAWFRFIQCLRRYRDTKRAFPHLVNAGKYSTSFFVVTFAALYRTHEGESHADAQIFFYLYISCLIVSSCYTLIWDLKMDWGLFDRNAGENTFLREEIVYPHKVSVVTGAYYYSAIVEDVLLRFSWTLTVTLSTVVRFRGMADILATVLAPMEVFRRFVWNFFRLENEHLNNCGEFRAVRDISVAPLNADDQTLLEQMMDQEDGVRNRQGKKSWKRTYSMSLRRPRLASQ
ncbi:unnamed protein product, partial [Tetraodon nigroviridis]